MLVTRLMARSCEGFACMTRTSSRGDTSGGMQPSESRRFGKFGRKQDEAEMAVNLSHQSNDGAMNEWWIRITILLRYLLSECDMVVYLDYRVSSGFEKIVSITVKIYVDEEWHHNETAAANSFVHTYVSLWSLYVSSPPFVDPISGRIQSLSDAVLTTV
jgi:hypothetical protein